MEINSIDGFLAYWDKLRQRTRRVLRRIPPERIEWTYREGKWTLGDLLRHVTALERWMFAETVHGRPSLYQGCGPELAEGYEAVVDYFERVGDETVEQIRALGDARLRERCTTPGGASLPVWKWLRAMAEHHVHHRGQIYLYLGLLEIDTPPLYGLTAEQVAERSTEP